MRILIVKLSSLGDVVHAMPAVQDLRRAHPDVQIDWVVERGFAPLVARCAGVDRVIPCDLRRWRKKPFTSQTRSEWRAFKAELQVQAYDAVVDLQGLSKSALVSWLARTTAQGQRVGMANRTEGSSFEAPARWVADRAIELEPHVHAVQRSRLLCSKAFAYPMHGPSQYGLVVGNLAATPPVYTRLGAQPNAFVPRTPWVALVHGTSRVDKQWPQAHWVELGKRLNHSGFGVALVHGSADEKATSHAIADQVEQSWVLPTLGLDALVDTLAHCAGVVGVDSGVGHIAVALGLPHVQIYNFDTAWRTGPEGDVRQVSVFAQPHPDVDAVWRAWEALDTPVLCR